MNVVKGRHRHVDPPSLAADKPDAFGRPTDDVAELLIRFPPRSTPATWSATERTREQVLECLFAPPFLPDNPTSQAQRRRGLRRTLDWLADQPGDTWQQRWSAGGAEATAGTAAWRALVMDWIRSKEIGFVEDSYLHLGGALRTLICADVIRPSLHWLTAPTTVRYLAADMARVRDPETFAELNALMEDGTERSMDKPPPATRMEVLCRIATIIAAKGGGVRDIVVGDCLELLEYISEKGVGNRRKRNNLSFYQALHTLDVFPEDAPNTVRVFRTRGQLPIEELIDRYDIVCRPVRDLIVDYLRERQVGLDHSSLRHLAYQLGRLFWKDLELHHPGISDIRLTPAVVAARKKRIQVVTTKRGTRPRAGALNCLTTVRAFYLDIAHWATEDPARWGPWVVPCPIRLEEASHAKERQHRKSRMDQRTREQMPILPVLVATADRRRRESAEWLAAAQQVAPGQEFTSGDQRLRRSVTTRQAGARIWADDPETGQRRDLTLEEHRGFWTWAAVEVLRATGLRIEELKELSHHSFVQYVLPSTGELIPLLHIAPSKTDTERLLVISPELADVLSAIVSRVRDSSGAVPLVVDYDRHERTWNPPAPLLFQRRLRVENRPIAEAAIRGLLKDALTESGITDASGQPLVFRPHDLRRLFITDAVMNGMPPHIAQLVVGHKDINTTMHYKAVYPEEVINGHRAFITPRRSLRPTEEYRLPTEEEWEEFLGHFERRKVALGTCGRAFSTPCIHEHSCLRCPLLRPEPTQRNRLAEVHDNLLARINEAQREGWLGEVEGLKVSLAGAQQKLAQVDQIIRQNTAVDLGMPAVPSHLVGSHITSGRHPWKGSA
ncbi:site-specific integrase [Streptomyces sp. NBC_01017]|uniref:tyrosine-type recombinase/integrase n=1 Tax=Streptomyces sp. NBC_01017 TaxID=2903721 RepID=UPI003868AD14|nr:site-specific integrase [Streptomyces sp. NBC_01017]WSV34734.1 site-specific integrase [Streptomyces sp. NBC_01017]